MKTKLNFFVILLFICVASHAQMHSYSYKREINGVEGLWGRIIIPDEVFGKISADYKDLRIFGITSNRDTVEAPYVLRSSGSEMKQKEVNFRLLNSSSRTGYHYFTFEVPTDEPVNRIELNFEQKNFDWLVTIEGSNDQISWFQLADAQRILSIVNDLTDFNFTALQLPLSKYRYFRLKINAEIRPVLTRASMSHMEKTEGQYRNLPFQNLIVENDKGSRQSRIDVDFNTAVPVSEIELTVKDKFDYYRPIVIQHLFDSVNTEKGWVYNYRTIASGVLDSRTENRFTFNSTIARRLRVVILNQDDRPLNIDTVTARGYLYQMVIRFPEKGKYFLTYGNQFATSPAYDIVHFDDKIPGNIDSLALGSEQKISQATTDDGRPLFENPAWLWVSMAIIIITLTSFSVRMIRAERSGDFGRQ